jgi:Spy/CpxP family protein refolding chaperone
MENNNSSRTRREAAALVFVVFLLGVLVGGVGNHLWAERVWGHQQPGRSGPPPRAKIVDDLTRQLQLTPDQQQEIGAIIDDTRTQMLSQHNKLRQEGRERIRATLTPEQQTKFEQFMQRIDEQRKREQSQSQH